MQVSRVYTLQPVGSSRECTDRPPQHEGWNEDCECVKKPLRATAASACIQLPRLFLELRIFLLQVLCGVGGGGGRGGGIQIVKEQQHNDIDLEELSADSH